MTDEKYEYIQDCKDKKFTARSARNKRTHNGKGGRVRLPSDNLSAKELKAMSGECKSYRMNDPMDWKTFKEMPEDLQRIYILSIRKKYNAPNSAIAEMLGVERAWFSKHLISIGVESPRRGPRSAWDADGFIAWRQGVLTNIVVPAETPVEEVEEEATNDRTPVEENVVCLKHVGADCAKEVQEVCKKLLEEVGITPIDICEDKPICTNPYHYMPVIPTYGEMSFKNIYSDDALATIKALLCNTKVDLTVSWEAV